jgi:hypothetical protein
MLIIGYPGVGKSSCCNMDSKFIDLESSNFIHQPGDTEWAKSYVNVALDLHSQGFIVFISSHYVVRDLLIDYCKKNSVPREFLLIIFPSLSLEDVWKKRIRERLERTTLEKDKRAYDRVLGHYVEDISSLINMPIGHLCPLNKGSLIKGAKTDHKLTGDESIEELLSTFDLAKYIKYILISNKLNNESVTNVYLDTVLHDWRDMDYDTRCPNQVFEDKVQ